MWKVDCCFLALVLALANLLSLAIFAGYTVKMNTKQLELKKEIQQVERVNGKEKADIKALQELSFSLKKEVKELKEKYEK